MGRLDMRADRAADSLEVSALWMELRYRLTRGRRQRLEAELERIRRFVGFGSVRFEGGYLERDG